MTMPETPPFPIRVYLGDLVHELKVQGLPPVPSRAPVPAVRLSVLSCAILTGVLFFPKNLLIFLLRNPISACAYPCKPRNRCRPGSADRHPSSCCLSAGQEKGQLDPLWEQWGFWRLPYSGACGVWKSQAGD